MLKSLVVLTTLAVAAPGLAFAGGAQQQKSAAPGISATQMTDAEMDGVTAGGSTLIVAPHANSSVTLPTTPQDIFNIGGASLGQTTGNPVTVPTTHGAATFTPQ